MPPSISFVCHTDDLSAMEQHLHSSLKPFLEPSDEFIVLKEFATLAAAYFYGESVAKNEYVCFVHHDVVFPPDWRSAFFAQAEKIEDWKVIGMYGARIDGFVLKQYGRMEGGGMHLQSRVEELPQQVDVIDGMCCIKRKGDGLKIDQYFDTFQGACIEDLCYQAKGFVWVADCGTVSHNTKQVQVDKNEEKRMLAGRMAQKWGLPVICCNVLWV